MVSSRLRLPEGIWKAVHLFAALCALRISDTLAARGVGVCRAIVLGLCVGLLVETLLAALTTRMNHSRLSAGGYIRLALRLPARTDLLAACVVLVIWCVLSPGRAFAEFKLTWLVAALFSAAAVVNPSNSRPRLRHRSIG